MAEIECPRTLATGQSVDAEEAGCGGRGMSLGEERERRQGETRPSKPNLQVTDGKMDIQASKDSLDLVCFAATAAGLWEQQGQGPGYSVS